MALVDAPQRCASAIEYRRPSSQVLIGVLVVLLGVTLLANTTGLYDTGPLLRYVPSLFVLVAVYAMLVSRFENLFGPLAVVVVAGTSQLVVLGVVEGSTVRQFWPVLVILFGLSVLLGRLRSRSVDVEASYLDAVAVFGGVERHATSRAFRGATWTALFGGTELDLRDAAVVESPARVSVTAPFGAVEVVVPREWNVRLDVLPILGVAEDERRRREPDHDAVDLVVTGGAAFGGVSVTD
jgi:hypothetical protein